MTNKELFKKMDMFQADLDGGQLLGEQAKKFIQLAVSNATIQQYARTVTLANGEYTIPRLGFNQRILRRGTEHTALTQAQRAKPQIDSITIKTHKFMAEVRMSYEVMKRNVEKSGIVNTIKEAMAKRIGLDVDDLLLNSETASLIPFFNAFNGMRYTPGIHSIDCGAAKYDKDLMKLLISTMPKQHRKVKKDLAFFCSTESEENYRDQLSSRATALGDKQIEGNLPLFYNGSRVIETPVMPEDLLSPPPKTEAIYTNPMNIIAGYDEKVQFEMDKDISSQQIIMVATIWCGFAYEDPDAVVRGYNIGL